MVANKKMIPCYNVRIMSKPNLKQTAVEAKKGAPWRVDLIIFTVVYAVILWRFGGLIRAEEMPGWDTPSHLYAAMKMAGFLAHGRVDGYVLEWLGGFPLFTYYAPLFFVAVAGFWLLTLKVLPLVLIFRLAMLVGLLLIPLAVWRLLDVFIGRGVARWGAAISLIYIFTPLSYGSLNIGASADVWIGLIAGTFGLSLTLLWLAQLERLRAAPAPAGRVMATVAVLTAAIALTHTISTIAAVIIGLVYLAWSARDRRFLGRAAAAIVLGAGLAAFWFLPFLHGLPLTSAEIRTELPISVWLILFPWSVPYLAPGVGLYLMAVIIGAWRSWQEKKLVLAAAFGAPLLVFLLRRPLAALVPDFSFHYHRLLPFVAVLLVVLAAMACDWMWQYWGEGTPRRQAYVVLLVVLLVGNYIFCFNIAGRSADGTLDRSPVAWSWKDFSGAAEAQAILDKTDDFPAAQRFIFETPWVDSEAHYGSLHYFESRLPLLKAGAASLNGLYVESSSLAPFIEPSIQAVTERSMQTYGDSRLARVQPFADSSVEDHLRRLERLGADYFAATSEHLKDGLARLGATKVGTSGPYDFYRMTDPSPLVFSASAVPMAYLHRGGMTWRDLAMVLWAGKQTYDLPVVELNGQPRDFSDQELRRFSLIIVDGRDLSTREITALEARVEHVLVMNAPADLPEAAGLDRLGEVEIIVKSRRGDYEAWPTGWAELQAAVAARRTAAPSDWQVTSFALTPTDITVTGSGPAIINAGYALAWRGSAGEKMYRVTPDEMLVFLDGGTGHLFYGRDSWSWVGDILSIISLIGLVVLVVRPSRPRPPTS